MRLKLAIEPRPASTWGVTLANLLPPSEWNEIRHRVYWEADYECVVCGSKNGKLFCHEVWTFDDREKIQRLGGFECCCQLCSDVHHFGRSSQVYPKDYQQKLITHWCKVNKKTRADFGEHLAEIRAINRKRANHYYIVKIGRHVLS